MSNELLDVYDENENFIEALPRDEVHAKGLWHRTTHCWLVKKPNTIIFQMRSTHLKDNPNKLYTTASGHVSAGETLKDALKREVSEELGTVLDTEKAELVYKDRFTADFVTTAGNEYHDRAFCNVFLMETDKDLTDFNFQDEELEGLFELPIEDTLAVIKGEKEIVNALGSYKENGEIKVKDFTFTLNDFLVLPPETPEKKFGRVLEEAIKYFRK